MQKSRICTKLEVERGVEEILRSYCGYTVRDCVGVLDSYIYNVFSKELGSVTIYIGLDVVTAHLIYRDPTESTSVVSVPLSEIQWKEDVEVKER